MSSSSSSTTDGASKSTVLVDVVGHIETRLWLAKEVPNLAACYWAVLEFGALGLGFDSKNGMQPPSSLASLPRLFGLLQPHLHSFTQRMAHRRYLCHEVVSQEAQCLNNYHYFLYVLRIEESHIEPPNLEICDETRCYRVRVLFSSFQVRATTFYRWFSESVIFRHRTSRALAVSAFRYFYFEVFRQSRSQFALRPSI